MKDKPHNMIEVIEFCKTHHLPADIVGRWVWVKFEEKPSTETRTLLKDYGFRWSKRRGEWAHNCGHPTKPGHCIPREKYTVQHIEDEKAVA